MFILIYLPFELICTNANAFILIKANGENPFTALAKKQTRDVVCGQCEELIPPLSLAKIVLCCKSSKRWCQWPS